jgi:hypothetical protein
MDFEVMQGRLARGEYTGVDDVRADFERICSNAMFYHKPGIVFHDWAMSMRAAGDEILGRAVLATPKKSLVKAKVCKHGVFVRPFS